MSQIGISFIDLVVYHELVSFVELPSKVRGHVFYVLQLPSFNHRLTMTSFAITLCGQCCVADSML